MNWEEAFPSGLPNPWLILSNSPETVTRVDAVDVLYRCAITVPASGAVPVRVFVWHINSTVQTPRKFWIACQIVGPAGGLSGSWDQHRQIAGEGGTNQYFPIGLCVSKAQLFDTLDDAPDSSGTIPATGPGKICGESINAGELYGALHEFTVNASPGATLFVWTCLSDDDQVGNLGSPVRDPDDHNRGPWPYANIVCESYLIQPIFSPSWFSLTVCGWHPISYQPDTGAFIKRTADTYGTVANKGLFGVNVYYNVEVFCVGTWYYNAYLRARNTGADYQGAAIDQSDQSNPNKGVPPLTYHSDTLRDGVRLVHEAELGSGNHDLVFPNATAGAATMPCELLLVFSRTKPVPDPLT